MDAESQDRRRAFSEAYISQNRQKWPTAEMELACAFVEHFRIPLLFHVECLRDFLSLTNIELLEGELPADLLAVNMSFEGKRRILASGRVDHVLFQVHTILHEIREMIEDEFRRLGFSTTQSRDLEHCADEFAFAVFMYSFTDSVKDWPSDIWEQASTWKQWVSLGLFAGAVIAALFYSFIGAYCYRFEVTQTSGNFGRQPKK